MIGPLFDGERATLSLSELSRKVRGAVHTAFPSACWVQAETSDVRTNASSGHCYLEFIEKASTGQVLAKARGSIWANAFRTLKPFFEQETGQVFTSGLKVLVKVNVEYHELYGFSLNVIDIDPVYTIGDMARRRQEIVRRLHEEGIFDLNRKLSFPTLPQRIAVITSASAAGYGDFMNQLSCNKSGYLFYTRLFPALMQGEKTEASVLAALEKIDRFRDIFDVVVIIRGGGAASELSCFDSYPIAACCAHFPLPVVTGIGHERDDTILDLVAHTRMKTPTAVAEFLIGCMDTAAREIDSTQDFVRQNIVTRLTEDRNFLILTGNRLPALVANRIERNRNLLQNLTGRLPVVSSTLLSVQTAMVADIRSRLSNGSSAFLSKQDNQLKLHEQFVRMAAPDYVLRRGYTLVLKEGKIVKRATELCINDNLAIRFADGEVNTVISQVP
ncbi:MAG: exodeoxyribonuclease VII large subunit [Tannerellaceae bacterium]|jgi:exodeoxyribonuclease VII large subunit|nr:exodeoxyribonuclease VII large subunit [Tannerellaceae bacterium]